MPAEADRFIEFGNVLDREKRRRLVEYIDRRVKGGKIDSSRYKDLSKYTELVDEVVSLLPPEAATRHEALTNQVASQILDFIQDSNKEYVKTNPYAEEKERLIGWQNRSPGEVLTDSESLFKDIRGTYPESEFPLSFYEKRVQAERKALEKDGSKLGALKDSILGEWERRLFEKETAYELSVIEKMRAEYCKQLYEQLEKYRKLIAALSPLTNELGRLWDLSKNVWQKTDLDILARYGEFLENEGSIRQLSEMLGRMDSAEKELREEERMEKVFETEWKAEHASKAELVGVHESDDLSSVLPTEVALLADKPTETYFFKKFAEKKLMTWEYETQILAEKEGLAKATARKPEKKDKGPIIICVDTSGSMHGEPEAIAKTVAFAILRIALREDRACYLISFSTGIQSLKLNDLRESLGALIDFLKMSFHAGTDPEPALREALKQLESGEYKDADVLVISDFIMDNLSEKMVKEIESAKKGKNRFHSLVISESPNPKVLLVFDNNWAFDLGGSTRIRELVIGVERVTAGGS